MTKEGLWDYDIPTFELIPMDVAEVVDDELVQIIYMEQQHQLLVLQGDDDGEDDQR